MFIYFYIFIKIIFRKQNLLYNFIYNIIYVWGMFHYYKSAQKDGIMNIKCTNLFLNAKKKIIFDWNFMAILKIFLINKYSSFFHNQSQSHWRLSFFIASLSVVFTTYYLSFIFRKSPFKKKKLLFRFFLFYSTFLHSLIPCIHILHLILQHVIKYTW